MNWKRPLGLAPLFSVLATLVILTAMLATMIWSRVSLLQNGTEIILKTTPIDPRDLLRGYFVRLNYTISRIKIDELDEPMTGGQLADGFKQHSQIFVKLQPDAQGFWSPISVHRTRPDDDTSDNGAPMSVFMRGRIRHRACRNAIRTHRPCSVSVRYGIEKFFAQKTRAKKLEDFGRQTTPKMKELAKQIAELQLKHAQAIRIIREQNDPSDTWRAMRKKLNRPEVKQISERLKSLRNEQRDLQVQNRKERAKRFAVLVRVDKNSGEAAISGLQLDGKRIYEERPF